MSKNSSSTSQHISAFSATQGMQSAMHEILPTRSDVAPTVPQRDHTAFTMLQTSMRDQLQSRPEQSAAKLNSRPGISNSPSINTCQQRMLQLPTDLPIPGQFQSPMGTRQLLDPYVASISASEADNSTSGGPRSLYVGKLHLRVNEGMLLELFSALGSVLEVKIIRDKLTSQSCGYGFVTFFDSRCAAIALQYMHGHVLFGQEIHINWASQRDMRPDTSNHFHVFVGDLATEVNETMLAQAAQLLGGCSDVRVVWDLQTGRSKGYGFMSFFTKASAENAIVNLTGTFVGSRAVRCKWAHHKKDSMQPVDFDTVDQADPTNANVYIGSISPDVSDAELEAVLKPYGVLLELRIFRNNCFAFAQYENHNDAVQAIVELDRKQIGGKMMRLSWGRHQARAAAAAIGALAPLPSPTPPTAGGWTSSHRMPPHERRNLQSSQGPQLVMLPPPLLRKLPNTLPHVPYAQPHGHQLQQQPRVTQRQRHQEQQQRQQPYTQQFQSQNMQQMNRLQSRLDPSYQEASNYMQPQQQQRQSVRESYLQTPEYRVSIGESPVGLPMVPAGTPAGLGDGQGPLVRPSDISALGADFSAMHLSSVGWQPGSASYPSQQVPFQMQYPQFAPLPAASGFSGFSRLSRAREAYDDSAVGISNTHDSINSSVPMTSEMLLRDLSERHM